MEGFEVLNMVASIAQIVLLITSVIVVPVAVDMAISIREKGGCSRISIAVVTLFVWSLGWVVALTV